MHKHRGRHISIIFTTLAFLCAGHFWSVSNVNNEPSRSDNLVREISEVQETELAIPINSPKESDNILSQSSASFARMDVITEDWAYFQDERIKFRYPSSWYPHITTLGVLNIVAPHWEMHPENFYEWSDDSKFGVFIASSTQAVRSGFISAKKLPDYIPHEQTTWHKNNQRFQVSYNIYGNPVRIEALVSCEDEVYGIWFDFSFAGPLNQDDVTTFNGILNTFQILSCYSPSSQREG